MSIYPCLLFLPFVTFVFGIDNGLGRTPLMGWRSWNLYGKNVNQKLLVDQMNALVDKKRLVNGKLMSLKDLGYTDVGLDGMWQKCGSYGPHKNTYHLETGESVVDTSLFPNLKAMTENAHKLGLTAGWYHNNCWCADHVTEEKYYERDAQAIAGFGFDSVKFDGCGKQMDLDLWAKKLNETGRPVLIENCHWGLTVPNSTWCPWNYYRTSYDIRANYGVVISNLDTVTEWLEKGLSKPGCWAYPDMIEIGVVNGPGGKYDSGLSLAESRTHFGAWAIVSSPIILSHDMTNDTVSEMYWPIIANAEAIAINQAWHGSAGGIFKESSEFFELFYQSEQKQFHFKAPNFRYYFKPLSDDRVAILMMNLNSDEVLKLAVGDIPGWASDSTGNIRDVWKHENVASNSPKFVCSAEKHDCCFLVVTRSHDSEIRKL